MVTNGMPTTTVMCAVEVRVDVDFSGRAPMIGYCRSGLVLMNALSGFFTGQVKYVSQ
jgi:hypothetical protein